MPCCIVGLKQGLPFSHPVISLHFQTHFTVESNTAFPAFPFFIKAPTCSTTTEKFLLALVGRTEAQPPNSDTPYNCSLSHMSKRGTQHQAEEVFFGLMKKMRAKCFKLEGLSFKCWYVLNPSANWSSNINYIKEHCMNFCSWNEEVCKGFGLFECSLWLLTSSETLDDVNG